ncbi:MAG: cytochrome-c oxidase, cbb3-type subunit III [Pseudomonadales bacterium]|nr:cytochrome-c oxidase, cbb3-type subunit III [Pseudomonadales bacterium]
MSTAFNWYVILGTFGSLLFFFLVLYMNRSVNTPGKTTGHNYDGIEEYDNPMPAWWFWGFVISILFAIAYLIYYPGLGNFAGLGGWSQINELEADQQQADAEYGPLFAQYRTVPIEELALNTDAMRMGRRLFATNCAVCHGAAGTGSAGFPNLTDSEWLWGDSAEQIHTTISAGRNAMMPSWEAALQDEGIHEVAEYVLQLAGREVNAETAALGQARFSVFCAACHGPDGSGQAMLGAPALNNDIWLYGNSRLRIEDVIRHGRNGQMPAFNERLGADKVHILSAYVKSLGMAR